MVTGPKPPPPRETQKEYDNAREVWLGLVPDPEKAHAEAHRRPFSEWVTTDKGVPTKNWENWRKWEDGEGNRPEGTDRLLVWRDPKTKRFAKPFNAREFARRQGLPTEDR